MLRILIACGEKALEAFQACDNPIDASFVVELERIVQRLASSAEAMIGEVWEDEPAVAEELRVEAIRL
jgi:hypothetical protein